MQAANGALWIAKFPSKHDEYNSGAWEKVTHDLARLCGLDTPESKLETFSKTGSTFGSNVLTGTVVDAFTLPLP